MEMYVTAYRTSNRLCAWSYYYCRIARPPRCGPASARARSDASTAVSAGPACPTVAQPCECHGAAADDTILEIEAMLQDGIFLETKDPSLG